jgi:hypothetical protein
MVLVNILIKLITHIIKDSGKKGQNLVKGIYNNKEIYMKDNLKII